MPHRYPENDEKTDSPSTGVTRRIGYVFTRFQSERMLRLPGECTGCSSFRFKTLAIPAHFSGGVVHLLQKFYRYARTSHLNLRQECSWPRSRGRGGDDDGDDDGGGVEVITCCVHASINSILGTRLTIFCCNTINGLHIVTLLQWQSLKSHMHLLLITVCLLAADMHASSGNVLLVARSLKPSTVTETWTPEPRPVRRLWYIALMRIETRSDCS